MYDGNSGFNTIVVKLLMHKLMKALDAILRGHRIHLRKDSLLWGTRYLLQRNVRGMWWVMWRSPKRALLFIKYCPYKVKGVEFEKCKFLQNYDLQLDKWYLQFAKQSKRMLIQLVKLMMEQIKVKAEYQYLSIFLTFRSII